MGEMTAWERIISEVICINEFGTMKDSQLREAVDDIIAIVREAMLSDEVVEAAAKAVAMESDYYEYDGPFIGLMVQANTTGDAVAKVAKAALQAALSAAFAIE